MSQQPKKSMREIMQSTPSSDKSHFADSLTSTDPKDLPARTRTVSPFATATLKLIAASSQKEAILKGPYNQEFNMRTLAGRMDYWQYEKDAYEISNDGKGRQETVDVMKLAAIGGADDEGRIASSVLNEGSKVLTQKEKQR
jgi:hypothetical protein